MADEDISNGVTVDTDEREDDEKVAEHAKKVEELELEKNDLSETAEMVVQSKEADKAEVSRLLHKFLSAKNDLEESFSELDRLNNVCGKKIENMGGGIEFLIRAKAERDNKWNELGQKFDFLQARAKLEKKVEDLEVLVAKTAAETKNLINKNKLRESRLNLLEERELSSMSDAMSSKELKPLWSMCSLLAAFSIGAAAAANVYFAKRR